MHLSSVVYQAVFVRVFLPGVFASNTVAGVFAFSVFTQKRSHVMRIGWPAQYGETSTPTWALVMVPGLITMRSTSQILSSSFFYVTCPQQNTPLRYSNQFLADLECAIWQIEPMSGVHPPTTCPIPCLVYIHRLRIQSPLDHKSHTCSSNQIIIYYLHVIY